MQNEQIYLVSLILKLCFLEWIFVVVHHKRIEMNCFFFREIFYSNIFSTFTTEHFKQAAGLDERKENGHKAARINRWAKAVKKCLCSAENRCRFLRSFWDMLNIPSKTSLQLDQQIARHFHYSLALLSIFKTMKPFGEFFCGAFLCY